MTCVLIWSLVMSFYSYDGLGSVRGLTDAIGTSLGQYHYDAYGLLIENTVSVANPYQFAGERFDNDRGLYCLRARYLDVETGRFHTLDRYEGSNQNAITLHKYLYANSNPVSGTDPSGNLTAYQTTGVTRMSTSLSSTLLTTTAPLRIVGNKALVTALVAATAYVISTSSTGDATLTQNLPKNEPITDATIDEAVTDIIEKDDDDRSYYFIHGTSSGAFPDSFADLRDIAGEGTDFGPGFYAFRLPSLSGVRGAVAFAKRQTRYGGYPKLHIYKIKDYVYDSYKTGAFTPFEYTFSDLFAYDVMIGEVSGSPDFGLQYKFNPKSKGGLFLVGVIPISR